jgi:hypothetical protein
LTLSVIGMRPEVRRERSVTREISPGGRGESREKGA